MASLLIRYALLAVALVVLNFALPRMLPGDPLDFGGDGDSSAVPMTAAARQQLAAYYRLDQPLPEQFIGYLGDLARGDLGWSISKPAPVSQLVLDRLPWTLGLALTTMILSMLLGIGLGLLAAWRGGQSDRLLVGAMSAISAIPEFLIGMAFLLIFAVGLRWFPLQGGRTVFGPFGGGPTGLVAQALDIGWHLVLPGATLVLASTAGTLLLTRGAVLGVRNAPYLTTARGKGLGEVAVAVRHALPNAVLPLVTLFGLRVGQVLGGAIVAERLFAVPGLGLLAYEAVRSRDYPVLQAVFLLSGLTMLATNFVLELGYRRYELRHGG